MSSKTEQRRSFSRGGLKSVGGSLAADERSRCFWRALEAAKQLLIFIRVAVFASAIPLSIGCPSYQILDVSFHLAEAVLVADGNMD
jgi:hypothetical protein